MENNCILIQTKNIIFDYVLNVIMSAGSKEKTRKIQTINGTPINV